MPEPGNETIETGSPENPDGEAEVAFEDLGLSAEVRQGIEERGYLRPTTVQARTIPRVLAGKDLIVRSKTGTGKTAAFGIPLLEKLEPGKHHTQAIVLCPTRELALQVSEEITALGSHRSLRVTAIYGGASMKEQTDALNEGSQIVVGTPGRVYDHIRRKNLDLSQAEIGVLDEADEMLNQGFYEEVTRILDHLPSAHQMLLFSATVPPDIDRLIRRFCHDPETILISGDDLTVEGIENVLYYTVDAYPKPRNLIYLLELEQPESAIVFCNTRDDTSLITAVLNRTGFDAEVINGDLPQKERERVMAKIKRGELTFLVATDIAARGIDISDLSHVINYSLPEDPAVYLHRVGRTGRIGKKGVAISLVSGRELVTLTALEKRYGIHFEERKLPSPEEARRRWTERHLAELKEASRSSVFEAMIPLAQDIKALAEGDQLVAFLLRYFFTHHRMDRLAVGSEVPREREPERPRERERGSRREEKPRRRERAEKAEKPETVSDPRGSKLWCNLGTSEGLDEAAIAKELAELSGVEPKLIHAVEAKPTHTYLYVDAAAMEPLTGLSGRERAGKKLRIEIPRPRR
jgi:ATP-dependent RNA helicase DeaD